MAAVEQSLPSGVPRPTRAGARRLFSRIRRSLERLEELAGETAMLVVEARDGRAWEAAGYATWEECAEVEFGISRSQAWRLVDQGRVAHELAAAAGVPEAAAEIAALVPARAAQQVKAALPSVADAVVEATKRTRKARRPEIVAGVVEEARVAQRDAPPVLAGWYRFSVLVSAEPLRQPSRAQVAAACEALFGADYIKEATLQRVKPAPVRERPPIVPRPKHR